MIARNGGHDFWSREAICGLKVSKDHIDEIRLYLSVPDERIRDVRRYAPLLLLGSAFQPLNRDVGHLDLLIWP
jgi:hypothetical protein